MNKILITKSEMPFLCPAVQWASLDINKVEGAIMEVMEMDVKSALGDALYIDLLESAPEGTFDTTFDGTFTGEYEKYETLMQGGKYTTKCGNVKLFKGLKSAIAYYAYARLIELGVFELTRAGAVVKTGENSQRASSSQIAITTNRIYSTAGHYLRDCQAYLAHNREQFPLFTKGVGLRANRTRTIILGD